MNLIKIQGIIEWPTPCCVKEVQSFLGFCNFYYAFIKDFSHIAHPLNNLTHKNEKWEWTEVHELAFQWLKKACGEYSALWTPDWSKQFLMDTDASGYALGVVISQEFKDGIHPITFHSWSLLPVEANYDAHDKELAGVIYGFKCSWPLFLGTVHLIRVCTDHKNLQYFHDPCKITGRQACWIKYL